jgi:hypothetical protein
LRFDNSSIKEFSEAYPRVLDKLKNIFNSNIEENVEVSLFVSLLMLSISSVYILCKHGPSSKDATIANANFLHTFMITIIERVNLNLDHQIESGTVYSDVTDQNASALFLEPYLPVIKLILLILGCPTMRSLEITIDINRTMTFVALCCSKILQFRKTFFCHHGVTENVVFQEDLNLIGFLPLSYSLVPTGNEKIQIDDPIQYPIRMDQIDKISVQFCDLNVFL